MTKIIRKMLFFLLLAFNLASVAQNNIRVMSYNLENYPNGHDADFSKIVNQINPDIIVVVEMLSQQGVNQFLNNSLTAEYRSAPVNIHNDGSLPYNDCGFYFKNSVLTLIQTAEISADTRVISEFKLVHNTTQDTLIIFGVHLKAYPQDSTRRASAVTSLRNRTSQLNNKTNYLVCGDFNIFKSTESAFQKLLNQSQLGYFIDMSNASGNWNGNSAFSNLCTYSSSSLNTRLDMILISPALATSGGIDYINDSFKIFGNDGAHFNKAVNSMPNAWFTSDVSLGTSVRNASDHLPIYADFSFGALTSIKEMEPTPAQFELSQNYPNPFNPATVISYQLPVAGNVSLKVYDMLGREVATLINEYQGAGVHHSQFLASLHSHSASRSGSIINSQLSSGVYFYRLSAGAYSSTKKMIVLK
ncbi:MAG: T9SS type A sorting domain-containing protein [Bacteroidetes bacterium]|nr:T9SS type A sorting domain-containing protein [Bacteroidota bacterium]